MDPPLGKLVSFQAQAKLAVPYCKETTPGPASWCVTVNVQDTSTVDIWHFLFMSSVSSNIFFWWLENVVRYSWLSRLRLCTDMYLRGEAFSVLVFFFFFFAQPLRQRHLQRGDHECWSEVSRVEKPVSVSKNKCRWLLMGFSWGPWNWASFWKHSHDDWVTITSRLHYRNRGKSIVPLPLSSLLKRWQKPPVYSNSQSNSSLLHICMYQKSHLTVNAINNIGTCTKDDAGFWTTSKS